MNALIIRNRAGKIIETIEIDTAADPAGARTVRAFWKEAAEIGGGSVEEVVSTEERPATS